MPTPRTIIVDVGGEDQPLAALEDLASVVEPDVQVLVIGDREDVTFYRHVTRGLRAHEYLYKPIVPDMVARHFGVHLVRDPGVVTPALEDVRGGRMIALAGARGGVGVTTIAANLAWHFAHTAKRHTLLLDSDMHCGTAAMLLGARTGPGLRTALEAPSRIDDLFIERTAMPINERLHILAAEEKLTDRITVADGAVEKLVGVLRRRYNYLIADLGICDVGPRHEMLLASHQRVIVLTPTLPSLRDALRMLALPAGPGQARRAVLLLNRLGLPGGLSRSQVEQALRLEIDVVIPDLPRQVGQAESMGMPASGQCSKFASAIGELARELTFTVGEPERRRRRLFGWLK